MEYPAAVTLAYCIDRERNMLIAAETENSEDAVTLGGVLDVSLDPETFDCVLSFQREDGTAVKIMPECYSPEGMTCASLGRAAAKAGYPVAPGLEFFVGLYIKTTLELLDRGF